MDSLLVVPVKNCSDRLGLHVILPRPLSRSFVGLFPKEELTITDFSVFTPLGRQHFVISRPPVYEFSGLLGSDKLVVWLGKPGGHVPREGVEALVSALGESGFDTQGLSGLVRRG